LFGVAVHTMIEWLVGKRLLESVFVLVTICILTLRTLILVWAQWLWVVKLPRFICFFLWNSIPTNSLSLIEEVKIRLGLPVLFYISIFDVYHWLISHFQHFSERLWSIWKFVASTSIVVNRLRPLNFISFGIIFFFSGSLTAVTLFIERLLQSWRLSFVKSVSDSTAKSYWVNYWRLLFFWWVRILTGFLYRILLLLWWRQ
jgi:hypothetical protein